MTDRHRVPCMVPGCKRRVSVRPIETDLGPIAASEGICAVHWRLVPLHYRRVYRRATRALSQETRRHLAAWNRLWRRCLRAAIERSVGI